VTGASGGPGEHFAVTLAAAGANVALAARGLAPLGVALHVRTLSKYAGNAEQSGAGIAKVLHTALLLDWLGIR